VDSRNESEGRPVAGLEEVKEYWDSRSPGLLHSEHEAGTAEFFADIERARYDDEFKYRYLPKVAEFDRHSGKQVLEVGVGLGTDLLQFAKNGSNVHGIDLTSGAIDLTRRRFELTGLDANLKQASFTKIPHEDDKFDLVYSFGVLHHSRETQEGIDEIFRVLKPGGRAIVMVYHKGFKYYVRKLFLYGIVRGELFRNNPQEIVNRHSEEFGESPLTRVFSRSDARAMFGRYVDLSLQCYRLDDYVPIRGKPISLSRLLLPRMAYRVLENLMGWNLVIKGTKPSS
jgi:SAM-dependent methyltransferase